MEQNIMILTQVVFKGFIEAEKRLPEEKDVDYIKEGILKTYKAGLLAQKEINNLHKKTV